MAVNVTIARNFRRNAKIPPDISDEQIWKAIQEHDVMVDNPEVRLHTLRRALGLDEIPGLVDC